LTQSQIVQYWLTKGNRDFLPVGKQMNPSTVSKKIDGDLKIARG